jgi:hypothetical protein
MRIKSMLTQGEIARGVGRCRAEDAGFEGVHELADAVQHAVIFNDVRCRISRQLKILEPAMMALREDATPESESLNNRPQK